MHLAGFSVAVLLCACFYVAGEEPQQIAFRSLPLCLQDAMKAAAEQDASAAAAARNRADQLMAEAEVAAAERLLQAAEIEYSSAMQEQRRLSRAVGMVRLLAESV